MKEKPDPLKKKRRSAKEIVSQMRATAKQSNLKDMDVKEMINYGRMKRTTHQTGLK